MVHLDDNRSKHFQQSVENKPLFSKGTEASSSFPAVLQEYKVSSFEQRLISEIEFRLERSPVEESDEEVQHDQDSAGQGVAPSFNQKLKHYKVFEGMPVTFSCKVHGDPKPKVGALPWTTREHYIMVILKHF